MGSSSYNRSSCYTPLKSIHPPSWKPVTKKKFHMIHKTPNVGRTTNCSHRHCIIAHHLSMGLSIAVYRLPCPPVKEEATDEIKNAQMTMVMVKVFFESVILLLLSKVCQLENVIVREWILLILLFVYCINCLIQILL